ncbi:MAG: RNA-binding protein [Calditrichaeota bacterium]|nr:MAG: RNA-binding protein [Calditrichota bacterium]
MESKLYVGNVAYTATEESLEELFGEAGNIVSVNLIKDRETGRSKGFAFVEFESQDDANNAIEMFNGTDYQERSLVVNFARPREERPRRTGGGGRDFRSGGGNGGGNRGGFRR